MAYGVDTIPTMAVPWEWWLFTNSPARHGFIVVRPFLRGEVVMSSYGESGYPIVGCLLFGVAAPLPRSLMARSGA